MSRKSGQISSSTFKVFELQEEEEEEEEDLLLFAALRRTKYNQKYKLKKQHDRIHIASSIDTSIADCSA